MGIDVLMAFDALLCPQVAHLHAFLPSRGGDNTLPG